MHFRNARCTVIDGDGVERRFARAEHNRRNAAGIGIDAVGVHDLRSDSQRAAAGDGADEEKRRSLGRNADLVERGG